MDTLIDLARQRAASAPDEVIYTFLLDGETQEARLTCAGLDRQARAIGALLQEQGARGERVLLLHPPGLEYITAFFGCLYAGAVAVPAYPPDPSRLQRTLPRLEALIADARARFVLTTSAIHAMAGWMAEQAPRLASLTWLASDEVPQDTASAWMDPGLTSQSLAFLQYTSGSTGSPRGVVLTHGNLLRNSTAIQQTFGSPPRSRAVSWLPPYHDMGLIGGILQPLYAELSIVLLSPLDFLQRPARWLEAISRYRARFSGGPNFAYDLCVRKTPPEQRATLDLSTWELAFTGAEPIRAETLERFAQAFAPSGFRPESFFGCYGLAEGTLCVTTGRKATAPTVRHFQREALERGEALESRVSDRGPGDSRTLVGCGSAVPGHELLIVDPASATPLSEGRTGEIWVRGPSVAQGYWDKPEETTRTFQAHRSDTGEGPWLRTGDLGFLVGGELFVSGRLKDLIILRGRNLYPQDLEQTAEPLHPALRPGCSAAFSVDVAGEERLVLVLEASRSQPFEPQALLDSIREAVAAQHQVSPYEVVLISQGSIPKTSSGKIQRRACRELYLSGGLELIARSTLASGELARQPAPELPRLTREALLSHPESERPRVLEASFRAHLARRLSVPEAALDEARPLTAFGLDSIHSVELKAVLEEDLGVSLPIAHLLDGVSLRELTARVLAALHSPSPALPPLESVPHGDTVPLSHAQERILFLEQLAPASSAYNIPAAVLLEGELDVALLGRSLATVLRRHEALRASFPTVAGSRVQRITPARDVPDSLFSRDGALTDLSALPEVEREPVSRRLLTEEVRRPFDLEHGPLVRARLLKLAGDRHLLVLTLHHLVTDGWSMGVLVRELGALYTALREGRPFALPELPLQYADFAAWQRRRLEEGLRESEAAWWKSQLAGAPPVLELPEAHPRPAMPSLRGAWHPLSFSPESTEALAALGRAEGATPFMTLLSAFLAVLHARTGRTDLVVGTDIANRHHPRTQGLIGLFVNQLVLRVGMSGNPTFRQLLARVKEVALGAYAHSELPFDTLVEALRPPRDARYNPLFQVMFVLENAPLPELALPGLTSRQLPVDDGGSPFDLSVILSESSGRLGGSLRYSTALFDAAAISRLAGDFEALLTAATGRPDATLEELRDTLAELHRQRKLTQAEALRGARAEKFRNIRRKSEG
ncbi:condensation domain-containing protein [Pyxidicoccus sp. MSG2]|uniref:condensation domain-containing protein n=1 Tax=Pyxidicoccus sp. MSG2 TaxID=2996790 RepID=UPI00226E2631|nr:condensation domain-containing protein [Pyxidicoccus sp. MSG2]MCY1022281.1 condensation domain-containing protein [Pyxidicoccus sp. MSG2]